MSYYKLQCSENVLDAANPLGEEICLTKWLRVDCYFLMNSNGDKFPLFCRILCVGLWYLDGTLKAPSIQNCPGFLVVI